MSFQNSDGADGVLPTKQARSQRRQRAILDAAHRLMESVGYEKMKMEQIATEADSSVGTLYQRFSNKDGLLDALLAEIVINLEDLIAEELSSQKLAGDRRRAIRKLVGLVVEFMRDNQAFVRAITSRQLREPAAVTPLQDVARIAVQRTWAAIIADQPTLDDPLVQARFAFGLQLVIGTATNAVLNRPGPLLIDDPRLSDSLALTVDHLMMDHELSL